LTDVERAKETIVSAFLRQDDSFAKANDNDEASGSTLPKRLESKRVTHHDFVLITPNSGESPLGSDSKTIPLPLHLETATQLGLMRDQSIPSLVASLLPDSAPSSCKRFLKRWLLVRPPPDVADAMSTLIQALKYENHALPNAPPLTPKVIPLIRARQASASVYRSILFALDAAIQLLDRDNSTIGSGCSDIRTPLVRILHHDTGIEVADSSSLKESFICTKHIIEDVVSTQDGEEEISDLGVVIPGSFFEKNENTWRGRVKKSAINDAHLRVADASMRLAEAVAVDFLGVDSIQYDDNGKLDLSTSSLTKSSIAHDVSNNIIAIKSVPSWIKKSGGQDTYHHPRDRFGKLVKARYTTERVEKALSDYIVACDDAKNEVTRALEGLSSNLVDNNDLTTILQASHLNLIASTAINHAASSNAKGWNVGTILCNKSQSDSAGYFNGLWPYWMDKSRCKLNSFELNGMFLLTAPNMSG
jgi:hypothetical protein